jgi:hypothetical protein
MSLSRRSWRVVCLCATVSVGLLNADFDASAQQIPNAPATEASRFDNPSEESLKKEGLLIDKVLDAELVFRVSPARSKLVQTKQPISRMAVTDPGLV